MGQLSIVGTAVLCFVFRVDSIPIKISSVCLEDLNLFQQGCGWTQLRHFWKEGARLLNTVCAKSLQSCPALCSPKDCSKPSFPVHEDWNGAYLLLPPCYLVAQQWRICLQFRRCRRHQFNLWVRKIPWRRVWQPTPVLSSGESYGQRSLAGYIVHRVAKKWTRLKQFSMHECSLTDFVILAWRSLLWKQALTWHSCFYFRGSSW